jgi:hypothetical protein
MKKHFELYPLQKPSEIFSMPSKRMIQTLKKCLQIESAFPGKPYGPADVRGSFIGLYKRGLLDININPEYKLKPGSWYVTTKGLHFLLKISDNRTIPTDTVLLSNIYKFKQSAMYLHNSMYNLKLISDQLIIK